MAIPSNDLDQCIMYALVIIHEGEKNSNSHPIGVFTNLEVAKSAVYNVDDEYYYTHMVIEPFRANSTFSYITKNCERFWYEFDRGNFSPGKEVLAVKEIPEPEWAKLSFGWGVG